MAPLHGRTPGIAAGVRLAGRWRYNRAAGRGIALSYDRSLSRRPTAATGRWRYDRAAGRGIALSYERSLSEPPPSTPARREPISPAATNSSVVRVLCFCGELFTFEEDAGVCPSCGQPAAWPTMSAVEQEMRADLEELLRAHGQGAGPE